MASKIKKSFINTCLLALIGSLSLNQSNVLATGKAKRAKVTKRKREDLKVAEKSKGKEKESFVQRTRKPNKIIEGLDEENEDNNENEEKESLFLRAKGPYKAIKGKKKEVSFQVGKDDYEAGKFVCIANPTYDLTFKSLFTWQDNTSSKEAQKRLISLLNSLYYPESENGKNEKQITKVTLVETTLITKNQEKSTKKRTKSNYENSLSELRCDLVCKCEIKDEEKEGIFVLYFDMEVQRKHIDNRIENFLTYQEKLSAKYNDEVKVIAFLDYPTEDVVEWTRNVREVKSEDGTIAPAKGEEDKPFQSMISLPKVVNSILKNEEIKIFEDKVIGTKGKRWLKLLGVRHWGLGAKDNEEQYFIVPYVQDDEFPELKSALDALMEKNINKTEFKRQVENVFNADKAIESIREGGIKKDHIRTLIAAFVEDNDDVLNFLVKIIKKRSLSQGLIEKVWSEAENTSNKTVKDFIKVLREKGLWED